MGKKIISILLVVVMMCGALNTAFAENVEALNENAVRSEKILHALGIVENIAETNEEYNTPVSRGNFTKMAVKLLGDKIYAAEDGKEYFYDTTDKDINTAYELKIVSGTDYKLFEPNKKVSMTDAAVIAIRAIGHSVFADKQGGYPNGYMTAAGTAGLFKGLSGNGEFTYGDACIMLVNALFAKSVVVASGVGNSYSLSDTEDILWQNFNAVYVKNEILNQIPYATLTGITNERIGKGYVKIGDEIYADGGINAESLFGRNVEFIYRQASGTVIDNTLLYINGFSNNEITINISDVDSSNGNRLYYYNGDKRENVAISDTCDFVYNGNSANEMNLSKINPDTMNGTVTFVDNNKDGRADVVVIASYTDYRFSSADINGGILYLKDKVIKLDRADSAVIYDTDGTVIEDYTVIPDEAILTVYENVDKTNYKIYLSTENRNEKVVRIDKRNKAIETETGIYKYSHGFESYLSSISLGGNYIFLFNINGEIAALSQQSVNINPQYGYLYKAAYDANLEQLHLRIFDTSGTHNKVILSDKAMVNGARKKGSEFYRELSDSLAGPQLIRFKLNSECEVSFVDTEEVGAKETNSMKVKRVQDMWYGYSGAQYTTRKGLVAFLDDAVIFKVPKDDQLLTAANYPEYLFAISGPGEIPNYEKTIDIAASEMDEIGMAAVGVYYEDFDAASISTRGGDLTQIRKGSYIITEVQRALIDEEVKTVITCLDYSTMLPVDFVIRSEDMLPAPVGKNGSNTISYYKYPERGDIISVKTGLDGLVSGIIIRYDKNSTLNERFNFSRTDTDLNIGVAYNKTAYGFNMLAKTLSDAPAYDGTNADKVFDTDPGYIANWGVRAGYDAQAVRVFVYEKGNDIIRVGTIKDIITYKQSEENPSILYFLPRYNLKQLFVINE